MVSDLCNHDKRFSGVFFLPKEFHGCLACGVEQQVAEIERLRAVLECSQKLVTEQAEDEGLWFVARTAAEDYLQQALRRLHEVIEQKSPEQCARETLEQQEDGE